MKYKKFTYWAIMPLWVKIGVWFSCFVGLLLFLLPLYAIIIYIIQTALDISDYKMKAFLIAGITAADATMSFMLLTFCLFPIVMPILLVACYYKYMKFKFDKFKLSNIRGIQKYNPDDIRKYFPEYKSKTEKAANEFSYEQDSENELQKAVDIINKQTQKLGKDKVMSIIEGLT
ncbi:MAG: hypothetical protein LBF71_02030 [Campylobacteraceae bacterium]|nr:hypothetical protein [Campylobacteraceae bacterium]